MLSLIDNIIKCKEKQQTPKQPTKSYSNWLEREQRHTSDPRTEIQPERTLLNRPRKDEVNRKYETFPRYIKSRKKTLVTRSGSYRKNTFTVFMFSRSDRPVHKEFDDEHSVYDCRVTDLPLMYWFES